MGINLLHRKESIILTTIEVIDEFGFHGLSTREVAKRVGISEPAIFKHFKTKSDLILAVLDHFSQYDLDIIESIRTKKLKPVEAIVSFIDTYATYYENYPAITALTQYYDILRSDPKLSEKITSIHLTRKDFIYQMILLAQKEGELSTEVDGENLTVIITGLIREWCLNWRISNYKFSLRERMLTTIKMVLEGFKNNM